MDGYHPREMLYDLLPVEVTDEIIGVYAKPPEAYMDAICFASWTWRKWYVA
ncbi:hypothetical protein [Caproiciproducens galactitolivorans]|uniref:hypothetical protein n=1 Tax=Caproiciproducens galactitolivorans TaxID=642589 RepID=UPI002409AB52|nr:hypothetical protein [Caproiciproducens galactitolivorans]